MVEIELEPDLSHCVQTLAKREYDRMMRELLESDAEDADLQERLEVLRMFLESTDFGDLRSRYEPHLVEGRSVRFTVRQKVNEVEYQMEVMGKPHA